MKECGGISNPKQLSAKAIERFYGLLESGALAKHDPPKFNTLEEVWSGRRDPEFERLWRHYTRTKGDSRSGGSQDPNRYSEQFVRKFLTMFEDFKELYQSKSTAESPEMEEELELA